MKVKWILITLFCCTTAFAQTKIKKSIPTATETKLLLDFEDPDLLLQTWDKNEVLVKGTVSINLGENDNAFELQTSREDGQLRITSILKDKENIPQRITIKKGDQEYYFKAKDYNDPEVQKFLEENGREYSYMSSGIVKEIKLEIYVPKNAETTVKSKYGLVEVKNFNAPLTIDAKYGKVDATIVPQATGELIARSRYGEILTNLDIKFDQAPFVSRKHNQWTEITARPGKGPRYSIESKYGTVYLRKP